MEIQIRKGLKKEGKRRRYEIKLFSAEFQRALFTNYL